PRFDSQGRAAVAEPTLLQELKRRESHIIHLTRRNKLAIYVSTQRARQSGVYHVPRGTARGAQAGGRLAVGVEAPARVVLPERNMDALVARYLGKYPRHLALTYEDFLPRDTERLSDSFVRSVADFLGLQPAAFDPVLRLRKVVQGSLADQLKRPREVRAAL